MYCDTSNVCMGCTYMHVPAPQCLVVEARQAALPLRLTQYYHKEKKDHLDGYSDEWWSIVHACAARG